MHPYQVETIAPLGTRRKARSRPSGTTEDRALRIVREDGASFAQCPMCGERLTFGTATGYTIHGPSDLAELLVPEMSALEREELRVALLNTRNRVLSVETVYLGNVSSSLVRIGELFTEAIRRQASSLILVHNHPSGDVTPSPDDLRLTAEALAAGRLLDVTVLDHLVIGGGTFVSLRDRGVAFGNPGDHRAGEAGVGPSPQGRTFHVETGLGQLDGTTRNGRGSFYPSRIVAKSRRARESGSVARRPIVAPRFGESSVFEGGVDRWLGPTLRLVSDQEAEIR